MTLKPALMLSLVWFWLSFSTTIISAVEVVAWGTSTNVPSGLSNVVALAAGGLNTVALREDNSVFGWGHSFPGPKTILSNVVSVTAGAEYTSAVREDGQVIFYINASGNSTIRVGLSNVVAVAAGGIHRVALRADGIVVAWGGNSWGQTNVPIGLSNVVGVAAGGDHSVALLADGTVTAWGDNFYNQTNVPANLSNVIAIAAGWLHSLALRSDGTVVGWGNNFYGQTSVPTDLTNAVAISAGTTHNLALCADGTVVQWGYLQGTTNVPKGLSNVVAVAAGQTHSVAVAGLLGAGPPQLISPRRIIGTVDHPFYCRILTKYGADGYTAEGLPSGLALDRVAGVITGRPSQAGTFPILITATNRAGSSQSTVTLFVNLPLPGLQDAFATAGLGNAFSYQLNKFNAALVEASGLPPGLSVDSATGLISGVPLAAGDFPVNLIVSNPHGTSSGTILIRVSPVIAWGAASLRTNLPSGLSNIVALAVGGYHSLALRADGTVIAWGDNSVGQTNVPTGLSNVVAVAAGYHHSLGLRSDGALIAWGAGRQTNVPPGLTDIVAIATGGVNNVALRSNGALITWGGISQTNVPAELSNVVAISVGGRHTLALQGDGTVAAWGDDSDQQTNVPNDLTNVVAVAAGEAHSLALRADGTIVAWGDGSYGATYVPSGLSNIVAVAAGWASSVALRVDGTVVAWGQQPLSGLSNVVAIVDGGAYHNLALLRDESIPAPFLQLIPATATLAAHGTPGLSYQLERATQLQGPWLPTRPVTFTNSFQPISAPVRTNTSQFFRLRRQ